MENRKIVRFEKDVLRHMRNDINEALKSVCDKYGVSITIGNIKFSTIEFTTKMRCVITNNVGGLPSVQLQAEQVVFNEYCHRYNLQLTDFGAKFNFGSDKYEICGIKRSSHKYPILVKNLNTGKLFKFQENIVRSALESTRRIAAAVEEKNMPRMVMMNSMEGL
jgi:hypothetical protein